MPKKTAKNKATVKATQKSAAKPKKTSTIKKDRSDMGRVPNRAMGAAAAGVRAPQTKHDIVRGCIRGCSGRDDFGPNKQLRNIPADAQCVQACVTDETGTRIIVTSTDTQNSIAGKL